LAGFAPGGREQLEQAVLTAGVLEEEVRAILARGRADRDQECREIKEQRELREIKEYKEQREIKEYKEHKDPFKVHKEYKELKDPFKEHKEHRDHK
jgi:hypothetical protein